MRIALACLLACLAVAAGAAAQEKSIVLPADSEHAKLKPGPHADLAQAQCQSCHSTDYIIMQPKGDAKQWDVVVTKMIKVFGAQITDPDAKAIIEYLATSYGPAK